MIESIITEARLGQEIYGRLVQESWKSYLESEATGNMGMAEAVDQMSESFPNLADLAREAADVWIESEGV